LEEVEPGEAAIGDPDHADLGAHRTQGFCDGLDEGVLQVVTARV
jgi:hypothetical protein